mmetsp:Transcript_3807/g.9276  ORF Transcript_3807/g.9276 Transcript_3807/m.9276 type:complete len:157 (+) Transcript_3807:1198-1668(+)
MGPLELILAALQLYFMLMNLTVERFYCHTPLLRGDARFLVPETLAFCEKYNPLFLLRPEWMRVATCVSAYVFSPFYALILLGTLTGSLHRFKSIVLLFIGAKLNAILFYHYMEFTSATPPSDLVPYFAVEGPYLLSIVLVLYKLLATKAPARDKTE